jgi:hypothetical protein
MYDKILARQSTTNVRGNLFSKPIQEVFRGSWHIISSLPKLAPRKSCSRVSITRFASIYFRP